MSTRLRKLDKIDREAIDSRAILGILNSFDAGDFSVRLPSDKTGVAGKIYDALNRIIEKSDGLAKELDEISEVVGKEGKLNYRAVLNGGGGSWRRCIQSVNTLVDDLVQPNADFSTVIGAVARGDLTQRMSIEVQGRKLKGEFLDTVRTVNTMVDQLNSFASEVTRVAREVGTEGRLGGQANVRDVAGTWKDLTDNVNSMASNLTDQVRNIADVTTSVAKGDLSRKITVDARGEILELKNTINTMVDQLNSFASEVTRVAREVGTEGRLGGQADVKGVGGTWKDLTDNVNFMASNLTNQVRNIAAVTTAVATGDLSKKITVDVQGELLELKNTVNTMVDQLNSFASEVTRVAREVGSEGKLGGQGLVKGVAGTWKDLTDSVNSMASNVTDQVRSISRVVTDVANGNLKRKLVLEAKGEIAQLADTINEMIDTLATFADQVTTVAREVGVQGRLGGQANVPGATGTWRDLTDNVNRLAANLTTQVRAIAEVATAVTKWDLSRSISVEAAGEVAALKDNINEMIRNLRETTEKSAAQDWLKTNVAKFTTLLQGRRDLNALSNLILSELAPLVAVQYAVFYFNEQVNGEPELRLLASYAYTERKHLSDRFRLRQGLVGQAAYEKKRILIADAPADYIQISSGLGEARPLSIVVVPVVFEGDVKAVIELASFQRFSEIHLTFLDQLSEIIAIVLNTIMATMRTEELLKQSQNLAAELQTRQAELTETNTRLQEQTRTLQESEERLREQQEELRRTNEELQEKAQLLSTQNSEVERKNAEIEGARKSLEEKAEQLAVSSKYKSEFLANMSHELRTPLNSMLILSKLLMDNPQHNLTDKQVEYAQTVHASGSDLLGLINEILDLSKIEAGVMQVEVVQVAIRDVAEFVQRTFAPVATAKQLSFDIQVGDEVPKVIATDERQLQQILKNLLSNAFKFTEQGRVALRIERAANGWSRGNITLNRSDAVLAFRVADTGIGIPAEKHRVIFEAFQQAEGGTTRKYGGTGLGLSISRELARLLGGEIRLVSEIGKGSTFTLYIPRKLSTGRQETVRQARSETISEPVLTVDEPDAVESISLTSIQDDRYETKPGDDVLLIVEDDVRFGRVMLELARDSGFRGILAPTGEDALRLAHKFEPQAITLDLMLPGLHGWSVLDRLKHDPRTRHIPVQVISAFDERDFSLQLGAVAYLRKPIDHADLLEALKKLRLFGQQHVRTALVVEDDERQRKAIVELIGDGDVHTIAVGTGNEALKVLQDSRVDCMIVDLGLPDMTGFQLIERIRHDLEQKDLRIVVYTGRELTRDEETELRRAASSIIVKEAASMDRLLEETTLFLHRRPENLPEQKRRRLEEVTVSDPAIDGKTVLIIDDDVRNVFALTSLFERYRLNVLFADNAREGLQKLAEHPEVEAALVDIMMPDIDGYEAIRRIRQMPNLSALPVFALTAKAMKGDREACLKAGATDYIAKPADPDHVISLLRIHMARKAA